jgi:hypothetical protein
MNKDLNPRARSLLDFSLFGALPKPGAMVTFGIVLGILPKLSEYVDPFLYFFIPGFFIFLLSMVVPLLRSPRKETFAFILCLPPGARKQAAFRFVNTMQTRLIILVCGAIVSYGASHWSADGPIISGKTASFAAVLLAQTVFLYLLILSAIVAGVLRPSKHDPRRAGLFHLRRDTIKRGLSRYILGIARTIAAPLNGPAGVILRRQVLYLLRHDFLTFSLSWAIAVPAITLVAFMVRNQGPAIISLSLFALLCLLLFITTSCLGDSAEKLHACPYYFFSKTAVLRANLLLALGFCAPFMILCLSLLARHAHESYLLIALDAGAFMLAGTSFCLSMAQLWSFGSRPAAGAVALTLVCGLLGLAIPWYGILFPPGALGIMLLMEMPERGQRLSY